MKATDRDIIETIENRGVASATNIAEEYGMQRQSAYARCETLQEDGKLKRIKLGPDETSNVAYLPSAGRQTVQTEELQGNVRDDRDNLLVDISMTDESPNLLIQGSSGGYKLDAWWEDKDGNTRQSCVHFKFGGRNPQDYEYDNEHSRSVGVRSSGDNESIVVTDTEPRANKAGYSPAEITVSKSEQGFKFEVSWMDEYGEEHSPTITAPLVDPRFNKEKFYEIIGSNMEEMEI